MNSENKSDMILKHIAIAIALMIGIVCIIFGIHMLYQKTTATIGSVSFSSAPILLIIGLILILVALSKFFKSSPGQTPQRSWLTQNWLNLLGILIAIVLLGVYIKLNYDPKTVEKYEVLVQLILIIVGITAAVGYGMFRWIWENIKGRVEKIAQDDRNVARAEVHSSLGYVWFQNYTAQKEVETDNRSTDYLTLAIGRAERALNYAAKLNEPEHEDLISRCKNNLAYYLTERHLMIGSPQDKETVLKLARYAYQVATRKEVLQYIEAEAYRFEETYAWVLWNFADDDVGAKEKARKIINGLQKREYIPDSWRKKIGEAWAPLLIK